MEPPEQLKKIEQIQMMKFLLKIFKHLRCKLCYYFFVTHHLILNRSMSKNEQKGFLVVLVCAFNYYPELPDLSYNAE